MNKRIQEFALQVYGTQVTAQEIKFAELIVRECANIANTGIDPDDNYLIGDDILKHFGVE